MQFKYTTKDWTTSVNNLHKGRPQQSYRSARTAWRRGGGLILIGTRNIHHRNNSNSYFCWRTLSHGIRMGRPNLCSQVEVLLCNLWTGRYNKPDFKCSYEVCERRSDLTPFNRSRTKSMLPPAPHFPCCQFPLMPCRGKHLSKQTTDEDDFSELDAGRKWEKRGRGVLLRCFYSETLLWDSLYYSWGKQDLLTWASALNIKHNYTGSLGSGEFYRVPCYSIMWPGMVARIRLAWKRWLAVKFPLGVWMKRHSIKEE